MARRVADEGGQVALSRGALEVAQHPADVGSRCAVDQPLEVRVVGELSLDRGLTGLEDAGVVRHPAGPWIVGHVEPVTSQQRRDRRHVPRLGVADVDERADPPEVRDHLIVDRQGALLVVERLTQRFDFVLFECRRGESS